MNSLQVREFIISLQSFVEESPLPTEVKSMVFTSMANDLRRMADEEVQKQIEERSKSQERKDEE